MYISKKEETFHGEVKFYNLTDTDKKFFEDSEIQLKKNIGEIDKKLCELVKVESIKDVRLRTSELSKEERMAYFKLNDLKQNLTGQLDYVKTLLDKNTFYDKLVEDASKALDNILYK